MLRRPASSGPVSLKARLGKAEPSMVAQPFPDLVVQFYPATERSLASSLADYLRKSLAYFVDLGFL